MLESQWFVSQRNRNEIMVSGDPRNGERIEQAGTKAGEDEG